MREGLLGARVELLFADLYPNQPLDHFPDDAKVLIISPWLALVRSGWPVRPPRTCKKGKLSVEMS